jgi:hypothetical protein
MKQRAPSLQLVIGCFILFGTSAAELFPDLSSAIEVGVMARTWEMYERIQGNPSKKTRKQIEFLEGAIERAAQRASKPDV